MENLNSNDALEVFVENYKKQLDKFCADVNIPRSQLMDFLLEKNDKILSQTKKLDIEMEKKKVTKFPKGFFQNGKEKRVYRVRRN